MGRVRPLVRARRGFTLIELLVVIAIIAILVGLMLPAVQKVRDAAARMSCQNNLKQMGLACNNYNGSYGKLPPGNYFWGSNNSYGTTWSIEILPYLEQDNLYKQYNQAVVNETAANAAVCSNQLNVYTCPSDPNGGVLASPESGNGSSLNYRTSSYRAVGGATNQTTNGNAYWDIGAGPPSLTSTLRGPLHVVNVAGLQQEALSRILDGTSNTLLIGEYYTKTHIRRTSFWGYSYTSYNQSTVTGVAGGSIYLQPDYDVCVAADPNANSCKRAFGALHTGGMNFVMCDGSVRLIPNGVDPTILGALATIMGGEAVPNF